MSHKTKQALVFVAIALIALIGSACQPKTVIVERTVEVEKEVTRVVTQVIEVEKIVTRVVTPVPTFTAMPTATPVPPTPTPTEVPCRAGFEIEPGNYTPNEFTGSFYYDRGLPIPEVIIRTEAGDVWPSYTYSKERIDRNGCPYVDFGTECYVPQGTYTIEVTHDGAIWDSTTYEFIPAAEAKATLLLMDEGKAAELFTPVGHDRWDFPSPGGPSHLRPDDIYSLEISELQSDGWVVGFSNLNTGESIQVVLENRYQTVELTFYYWYYNKKGERIDATYSGFVFSPARRGVIREWPWAATHSVSIDTDKGTIGGPWVVNLPAYYEDYSLDGERVSLEMAYPNALAWLRENRTCEWSDYRDYPWETAKPDEEVRKVGEPPKELTDDRFTDLRIVKIQGPASEFAVNVGEDKLTFGGSEMQLYNCDNPASAENAQSFQTALDNLDGLTAIIWLVEGQAALLETWGSIEPLWLTSCLD
ncbi:hypothetical protein ACFLZP_02525 [Patescibacteria group bacterium]